MLYILFQICNESMKNFIQNICSVFKKYYVVPTFANYIYRMDLRACNIFRLISDIYQNIFREICPIK